MPDDWGFEVPIYYYRDLSTMVALVRSRKMREMMKALREMKFTINVTEDMVRGVYSYKMKRLPRFREKLDGSIDI